MADHLSAELLEDYRRRRLEPAQLLALDDHLVTCSVCRENLREMRPGHAALLALQESVQAANQAEEHLTDDEVQRYAEGRLDNVDRELADNHFETCALCSAHAERFRVSTQQRVEARMLRPALLDRITAALRSYLHAPVAVQAGSIALLALLLFGAATLWLRMHTEQAQVAVQPREPSPQPAPSTPPIVIELNDGGGAVRLDAQGNLTGLDSLAPADRQQVRAALMTQQLELPKIVQELHDSSSAMMGATTEAGFALLSPVGRIVAASRPTLRWRPLESAISYQVTITDPAAGYKEVAVSERLGDTKWRVSRPLERGRLYTWQVTARTGAGEVKAPAPDAPEARFRILERANAEEIARAERTYAGKHLVMGILYAEAGLLEEAEDQLGALVAANPASTVARTLLQNVRVERR